MPWKPLPFLVVLAASLLGSTSLLCMGMFLLAGPVGIIDLRLSEPAVLGWNGLLSGAFFVQHSGMIRKSFRRRLETGVPDNYHKAIYAIASGLVLFAVLMGWQESNVHLLQLHGAARLAARGVFVLAVLGFVWGLAALESLDAFGVHPMLAHVKGTSPALRPLRIRGPYRCVRHPLYFFALLMFWSYPDVSPDRLLFNLLWTAWVAAGALLEERDLVAEYGEPYREYQRQVPMLIPWRVSLCRRLL